METDKKNHPGKDQVSKSKGNIDYLIRTTNEDLNLIKFKNEKKQKETRLQEEQRRQERYEEIQQESIKANKKNTELEMKWNELKEIEECEELNRTIEAQKSIFQKIIDAKDAIIKTFLDELSKKDDDYGKMIKEQAIDISTLIKQMRAQFFQLRDRTLTELENIESQFIEERTSLLNQQQDEIKGLFNKHTDMEKRFVEERDQQEMDFTAKIEKLRIDGAKSYAELKISMETEIQNLEKCYEDMKALYQLNTEKLDYNLKVLKEKQEENAHLSDELKRKDQNLNNRLRKLTKDYIDFDKKFKQTNKGLTQEYKRITRQFKELQRKFKHFEKADLDRYNQIQKMNELEVDKLKNQILKCDLTIHVQQLGTEWIEPQSEEQKDQLLSQEKSKLQGNSQKLEQEGQSGQQQDDFSLPVPEHKLQEIIDMVLTELDFLIDDKLRENLENAQKRNMISEKLDVIKKCINIDSIDEMIMFIEELVYKCRVKHSEENMLESNGQGGGSSVGSNQQQQGQCDNYLIIQQSKEQQEKQNPQQQQQQQQQQGEGQQEEQQVEAEPLDYENFELNENVILEFLMNWMDESESRKQKLEKMSSKRAVKQETERQKKERIAKEGKKYWEKLTQVLPERTFRVWRVLDKALSTYYNLLLQRQKLIEETGALHNQNEELKNLMNQYLQINHELIIPPTRLIKLDQSN